MKILTIPVSKHKNAFIFHKTSQISHTPHLVLRLLHMNMSFLTRKQFISALSYPETSYFRPAADNQQYTCP